MVDSDLVALDTGVGLSELSLVALQYFNDLLAVIAFGNHVHRLDSCCCARYDAGGHAIAGCNGCRRTGRSSRGRLRVVEDLADRKLLQIYIRIGLLQFVEGTAKLFCNTVAIVTLLAGVLTHDHRRCCGTVAGGRGGCR